MKLHQSFKLVKNLFMYVQKIWKLNHIKNAKSIMKRKWYDGPEWLLVQGSLWKAVVSADSCVWNHQNIPMPEKLWWRSRSKSVLASDKLRSSL